MLSAILSGTFAACGLLLIKSAGAVEDVSFRNIGMVIFGIFSIILSLAIAHVLFDLLSFSRIYWHPWLI